MVQQFNCSTARHWSRRSNSKISEIAIAKISCLQFRKFLHGITYSSNSDEKLCD